MDKIPRTTVVREPSGLVLTPDGTPRSPKAWLTNKNGWASGVTTLLITACAACGGASSNAKPAQATSGTSKPAGSSTTTTLQAEGISVNGQSYRISASSPTPISSIQDPVAGRVDAPNGQTYYKQTVRITNSLSGEPEPVPFSNTTGEQGLLFVAPQSSAWFAYQLNEYLKGGTQAILGAQGINATQQFTSQNCGVRGLPQGTCIMASFSVAKILSDADNATGESEANLQIEPGGTDTVVIATPTPVPDGYPVNQLALYATGDPSSLTSPLVEVTAG